MSDSVDTGPVARDIAALIERLDELAFTALREASAAGERERPAMERRITRARRALERALVVLESAPTADDGA